MAFRVTCSDTRRMNALTASFNMSNERSVRSNRSEGRTRGRRGGGGVVGLGLQVVVMTWRYVASVCHPSPGLVRPSFDARSFERSINGTIRSFFAVPRARSLESNGDRAVRNIGACRPRPAHWPLSISLLSRTRVERPRTQEAGGAVRVRKKWTTLLRRF